MTLPKISQVVGRAVPVPGDDIDTDRIIPARFMKCLTFDGLGEYLFYDTRFDGDGSEKSHNLNLPCFRDASIMVSGANFGCGSSREHAPQSLYRAGFRAIIAGNFAEIFFGNATSLGMPCVSTSRENLAKLSCAIETNPSIEFVVDVEKLQVRYEHEEVRCEIAPGARDSLLNGSWDPLEELLTATDEIEKTASSLPYG
ncbi:MAG: 3-isopropylmalate dehydratase small subunit [Opitutae bacterium]|jgi:3-isopropylmalate/(R)-2-methylmalate dehydratase small subunit|nr:3-isopropylmalate dehydratase small subunit [Opitutae bacterium]|tara:strand:+ start:5578 stop:6174 length:597 start_codon:yes stop_codon:yes gene_type:complete